MVPCPTGPLLPPRWVWWSPESVVESAEIGEAEVIIVPGLAGTAQGVRLGQGGGWYDRTLMDANPRAPRWILLNDCEVLPHIPRDPWDQTVTAIITEDRWIDCAGDPPTGVNQRT